MSSTLRSLSPKEIQSVHGGHGEVSFSAMLEWPHIFMGFKEFTNYIVDLSNGEIADDDHFTNFFASFFRSSNKNHGTAPK